MKLLSILFGVVLTVLGIMDYTVSGSGLLPTLFGLLAILFGFLQGQWEHKHPLYGVVMMAILSLISSLRGLWNLFLLMTGQPTSLPGQLITIRSVRGALSILFIVLAIFLVKNFWHHWKSFGEFLGNWLGRAVLTLFYFTVFVPFGLGVRLFGDPLHIKSMPDQFWRPRKTGDQKLEEVMRQF